MRPAFKLRKPRPVHVTAGALIFAIPTSAVALSAGAADAQSALQLALDHQSISYGQSLTATGIAPRSEAGRKLVLELAPAGGPWGAIGTALVHSDGRFRIVVTPRKSGAVRVASATGAAKARAVAFIGTPAGADVSPSATRTIAVKAALDAPVGASGKQVVARGTLLPASAGHVVLLEGGSGHGWRTLARARTRADGRFELRYGAGSSGRLPVRVHFAGDRFNGATATRAQMLTFYRQSVASWYSDGGPTACGFHATFGVANRDLPCGTKVTFRYAGHTVTATVDDRGPFVGGRDWDLNQNTAGALGFSGVDTVWTSM